MDLRQYPEAAAAEPQCRRIAVGARSARNIVLYRGDGYQPVSLAGSDTITRLRKELSR